MVRVPLTRRCELAGLLAERGVGAFEVTPGGQRVATRMTDLPAVLAGLPVGQVLRRVDAGGDGGGVEIWREGAELVVRIGDTGPVDTVLRADVAGLSDPRA